MFYTWSYYLIFIYTNFSKHFMAPIFKIFKFFALEIFFPNMCVSNLITIKKCTKFKYYEIHHKIWAYKIRINALNLKYFIKGGTINV